MRSSDDGRTADATRDDGSAAQSFEYLLRLGDSALVLGHRLSQWCGHAPVLEEDLALANVALDLIGQAELWLNEAGRREGAGRDADALAYRRDVFDYRNLLLVEQPNGDFAMTMARQLYFDTWHVLQLGALAQSGDERIAEIAAKSSKEVRYHLERSRDWVVRLGDGTEESHARMQSAIDELWMYTGEALEADATDLALAALGLVPDPSTLSDEWHARVSATLQEATLTVPEAGWMQSGGKRGAHGEHLGLLLAEMQFLPRAYPDARW